MAVLEEIVAAVGLPADDVWEVLTVGLFAAVVDEDWLRAREMGVTVVPFYLYGEEALVGFRPYEDFIKLVDAK